MDAEGVCSENKDGQPAMVVVPTPEEERLAEGDSAVVAEPLTADVGRIAEGSNAVVEAPLIERVSGDSDTEPFEGPWMKSGIGTIYFYFLGFA